MYVQKRRLGVLIGEQPSLGDAASAAQRVRVPVQRQDVEVDFKRAMVLALDASINLRMWRLRSQGKLEGQASAAEQRANQHLATFFGQEADALEIAQLFSAVAEQLKAVLDGDRFERYDGTGADPFAGQPATVAINQGRGVASVMMMGPAFFNSPPRIRASTLVHEASHALVGQATLDLAYEGERLFQFLGALGRGAENADSVAAFATAVSTGQLPDAGPQDQLQGLTGEEAQNPQIALGYVGLAGRACKKAAERLAVFCQLATARGVEEAQDSDPQATLDLDYLLGKGLLRPVPYAEIVGFATELAGIGDNLHNYAARAAVTWVKVDPGPDIAWPQWDRVEIGPGGPAAEPRNMSVTLLVAGLQQNGVPGLALFLSRCLDRALGIEVDLSSSESSSDDEEESDEEGEGAVVAGGEGPP